MGIPAGPMTKSMIDEVIEDFVLAARIFFRLMLTRGLA